MMVIKINPTRLEFPAEAVTSLRGTRPDFTQAFSSSDFRKFKLNECEPHMFDTVPKYDLVQKTSHSSLMSSYQSSIKKTFTYT